MLWADLCNDAVNCILHGFDWLDQHYFTRRVKELWNIRSSRNISSIRNIHIQVMCIGWDCAYSLMDQNVSPEGESAICCSFVWFDIHVLTKVNTVCIFVQNPCCMGLPREVLIVMVLCHFRKPAEPALIIAFLCAFPQMCYQYKHGNPSFAFYYGGVFSKLSLWVTGKDVFYPYSIHYASP